MGIHFEDLEFKRMGHGIQAFVELPNGTHLSIVAHTEPDYKNADLRYMPLEYGVLILAAPDSYPYHWEGCAGFYTPKEVITLINELAAYE